MKDVDITVLVRGNDKAKVYNAMGVKSALFDSFDDTETIKGIAREHDSQYTQNFPFNGF
jgi:hypothetical protein